MERRAGSSFSERGPELRFGTPSKIKTALTTAIGYIMHEPPKSYYNEVCLWMIDVCPLANYEEYQYEWGRHSRRPLHHDHFLNYCVSSSALYHQQSHTSDKVQ
jgi:hypothetical protein